MANGDDRNRRKEDKEEAKEQGRFEGKVIESLKGLASGQEKLSKEFTEFKTDIYAKVGKNTNSIARAKGWAAGIALAMGALGGKLGDKVVGLLTGNN